MDRRSFFRFVALVPAAIAAPEVVTATAPKLEFGYMPDIVEHPYSTGHSHLISDPSHSHSICRCGTQ